MDTYLPTENNNILINTQKKPQKIAIIGSGISGLSAAWLLSKNNNVYIYEKNSFLGGHSNTISINYPDPQNKIIPINVDTGFIVYNDINYPNLNKLFQKLKVKTINSDMSFSFSIDNGKYEYSGSGLNGIFGQRKNLFKTSQWKLILDIIKFSKIAKDNIYKNNLKNENLKEWLHKNNFSSSFIYNYIVPMSASIWSCSTQNIFKFPANSFLYFFYQHGLLNFRNRPNWKTVKNGSVEYIKAIKNDSNFNYKLNSEIKSIIHKNNKIYIEEKNNIKEFDKVIMACHPHQVLKIYKNINDKSKKILKLFKYSTNQVVLHRSDQYMPKNKKLWSSWNYFTNKDINTHSNVQVTYWMNKLQKINHNYPLFITLNVNNKNDINQNLIFKTLKYKHPIFNKEAFIGQEQLKSIQGINNIWYSGAWTGYGFHEDGIKSGLLTAEKLGANCPWKLVMSNNITDNNMIKFD